MRYLAPLASMALATVVSGCSLFHHSLREGLADVEMVRVEGGTFMMGDFYEGENDDALPVHPVTVETFYLARYETTFEQYDAYARATGRPLPDDEGRGRGRRPVVNITWDEAQAFCARYGYRLPTEAEWEYAARAGGKDYVYAGTNTIDDLEEYALYRHPGTDGGGAEAVGRRLPNRLGFYDMSGNVGEWVGAYYQQYPEPGTEPTFSNMETFGIRIIRGGSFVNDASVARTYWRAGTLHDISANSVGVRCAADG